MPTSPAAIAVRSTHEVLQEPFRAGRVALPNRIVSAPMERNYCSPEGYMTPLYRDYLLTRARAGVGLVFTEATFVRADGRGRPLQMGMHRDECIPEVRLLADELHAAGAMLGIELNHGGRTAQSSISGLPSVAPSADACEVAGGEMPRSLSEDEVVELAQAYGEAAARCVEAGVDVIEIHGGHGYLIHQFMSPLHNTRRDRFGDPNAFLDLVIENIRAAAPGLVISLRVSAVEGVEGGLTAGQQFDIISRTRLDLLDYLDISAGSYESGEWIIQSGEWPPGFLSDYAARYRALGLPLGMAGRINSPESAAKAITDGVTDFVTIGRALHADPGWARVALTGTGSYRPCIACNVCIDGLGNGPVVCTVNPDVGRGAIPLPMPRVASAPSIAVIGSGPAGLAAATTLARRGAAVTVFEKNDTIGGQLELAARQKSNPEYKRYLRWAEQELDDFGAKLQLSTRADTETIERMRPDAVIVAVGGVGHAVGTPGADAAHVHDLRDWLRSVDGARLPEAVTIIGGDGPALSVADTLADRGVAVLLVAQQPTIAPELGRRSKILVLPRLDANPEVQILLATTVTRIEEGRIEIVDAAGTRWLDSPGPVLISAGARPQGFDTATLARHPFGVQVVGEATGEPLGSIRKAIVAGTEAARQILTLAGGRP